VNNNEPIIQVESLTRTYEYYRKEFGLKGSIRSFFHRKMETVEAVKNISFTIDQGEFVGFIGPNGAGKTTTLKMLSGVLHPTSGSVRVLDDTPQDRRNDFLKQIGFVMGQKDSLFDELPAMELFLLMRDVYEIPHKEFDKALDTLAGLLDVQDFLDIQTRRLSLGQRMKCELISCLLHMPRVLFLDEPTIGLDVASQKMIREFFRNYNSETGATILLTSHYLEDIKSLCERIIFIDHGQILFDGPIDEIIERYAPNVHISFSTNEGEVDDHKKAVASLGEIEYDDEDSVFRLLIDRDTSTEAARQILNTCPVHSILIEEPSMEEVVTALGGDHAT
jgi:ABC-2 type transport system ATP-binding protein